MGLNVGQLLRQAALRTPARAIVVDEDGAHRADTLDESARRVAAGLRARGVQAGDRVALVAANSAGFVAAWFGVLYAGATVVPIPIVSAPPELQHRLTHARCKLLLVDEPRRALAERAGRGAGAITIDELLAAAIAPIAVPTDGDPGAPAMILYTSGTTAVAKGALISHAALLVHTAAVARHGVTLDERDTILGALPLTHSFGCRMVMLLGLYTGARVVLTRRFDAAASLALIAREQITWVPAVPTMLAAWVATDGAPPPLLRWCLSAGAPLADALCARAEARLGCEIRQGYGLTEATFSTINAPPDARVIGSVGKPVWGVELRLTDGEVEVRGHHVMSGYLDDPAATLASGLRDPDGWLRTGDVGRLDAAGRLYVVDRKKDLIIRGGNNVYPSEVEAALATHAGVAEVAVVGRPDDYFGEEVVAVIVRRAGSAVTAVELVAWAKERVASTKVPRELAFVDALPLGPSGKVQKRALRAQLSDGTLTPERVPSPRG